MRSLLHYRTDVQILLEASVGMNAYLNDVLLDVRAAVVLWWCPVDHAVVLVDVSDLQDHTSTLESISFQRSITRSPHLDALRWRWHIQDVDMDVFLILTLRILHDHLVHAGLFALGIDHIQLNAVTVNSQLKTQHGKVCEHAYCILPMLIYVHKYGHMG